MTGKVMSQGVADFYRVTVQKALIEIQLILAPSFEKGSALEVLINIEMSVLINKF